MSQTSNGRTKILTGSLRARPRPSTRFWGFRRALPRPAAIVSDEQIHALVDAATRLCRRQREWCRDAGTAAADQRLRHLDWTVRAGRRALADRAVRELATTEASAQLARGQL